MQTSINNWPGAFTTMASPPVHLSQMPQGGDLAIAQKAKTPANCEVYMIKQCFTVTTLSRLQHFLRNAVVLLIIFLCKLLRFIKQ